MRLPGVHTKKCECLCNFTCRLDVYHLFPQNLFSLSFLGVSSMSLDERLSVIMCKFMALFPTVLKKNTTHQLAVKSRPSVADDNLDFLLSLSFFLFLLKRVTCQLFSCVSVYLVSLLRTTTWH